MSPSTVKLSNTCQAASLHFFPAGTRIDSQSGLAVSAGNGEPAAEIGHLAMHVGDTLVLTVAARLTDGRLVSLNEADAPGKLRLYSDDYGVWAGSVKPAPLTARQASSRPAVITAELSSGIPLPVRFGRLSASLEVTVVPGQRFIVFAERPLAGVPLAFWRFGRRQVRAYRRRIHSYQYMISGGCLELPENQPPVKVGWAGCDNLAAGWKPIPAEDLKCSHPNCISCGEPDEQGTFSLSCTESRRRPAYIELKIASGETRRLQIKTAPPARDTVWKGLEESPQFKTRSRIRWEKAGRTAGLTFCSLFALIWLAGCCLAQIQARGVWPGISYTLYMLGLGLSVVIGLTVVITLISAVTFALLRKIKK